MTEAELQSYRRRLLTLKKRHGGILTELEEEALRPGGAEAGGGLSEVPVHPADLAPGAYDQEITLGLLENEAQLLAEIHDALLRIEQGSYGRCVACGQAISRRRLDAIPYAPDCLRCAKKRQGTVWSKGQ
ncbi:MAG TPA: TraR/DksA C4-type zinc finger protein [Gemmataceae bacterium]|nr:TraR/DksA C4-type zinc finger protein [Gemmataceae bacterium]